MAYSIALDREDHNILYNNHDPAITMTKKPNGDLMTAVFSFINIYI